MIKKGDEVRLTSVTADDIQEGYRVGKYFIVGSIEGYKVYNKGMSWWFDINSVEKDYVKPNLRVVEEEIKDKDPSLTVNLKIDETLFVLTIAKAREIKNLLSVLV